MNYVKIVDGHQIEYLVPENFKDQDRPLFFEENFKFNIPSVYLISIQDVIVSQHRVWHKFSCKWGLTCHYKPGKKTLMKNLLPLMLKKRISIESAINGQQDWFNNYFHWMTEMLPHILAIRSEKKELPVLIPETYLKTPYIRQSLEFFDILLVTFSSGEIVSVKNFFASTVPHVGRFNENILKRMVDEVNVKLPNYKKPYKRIYVSRKMARMRKVINEVEMLSILSNFGFEVFYPEDHSLIEQIKVFRSSSVVISSHGAGLTNLMFMESGCSVIELKADNNDYWCYFSLSRVFSLKYFYLLSKGDRLSHRTADITVELDSLEKILQEVFPK